MNRQKLTRTLVDELPKPDAGRLSYYVYDTDARRLAVRVMASGRRFYTVRVYVGGVQRWMVIGEHGDAAAPSREAKGVNVGRRWTPEEARKEAERLVGEVRGGTDPSEAKAALRGAPTLKGAAVDYIDAQRGRKRASTLDADLRLLGLEELREKHRAIKEPKAKARRILDEPFARKKLPDVTLQDIDGLMKRWRSTPIRANRALALLSHLFSWARTEPNPCAGVTRNHETKRQRFLDGAELLRLGSALARADEDPRAVAAIRVLLFTGARRSEVLTLEWERREGCSGFLDAAGARLVLLTSKTGHDPRAVLLPPPALEVFRGLKEKKGNPFVFAGEAPGKPLQNIGHVWERVRKAARLDGVRLHDLRHGFASAAVSGGASLPIIGALLGHTQPATTARYAHLQTDPLRIVADAAARSIAAALDGKSTADVLPMRGRRKRA